MDKEPSLQILAGMLVSHVWFSDHSICYLELGLLSPGRVRPNGSFGNPVGEITIFLGYDWLVRNSSSKVFREHLHKHEKERDALVAKIIGATVESAILVERGREIEICMSTGDTLMSASSETDEPDWTITAPVKSNDRGQT